MTITSIVSHGPGALETGPVCYGGAAESTIGKARMYSEQVYEPTIRPKYCSTLSCEKEPAYSDIQDYSKEIIVPKVLALSTNDKALKTIDAVDGSAVKMKTNPPNLGGRQFGDLRIQMKTFKFTFCNLG